MSDHVEHHISRLYEELAHLRGIVERTHRMGKVTDVDYSDATKPRFRMEHGVDGDGQPVKGPWQPHTQHAGDRTVHTPLTIGQTMLSIAPDGNFENAVAMPYGFSSKVKSPSTSKTDHVDQIGDVTTTLNKDSHTRVTKGATVTQDANGHTIKAGGVTVAITSSGVAITGGKVTHNGKDIGADHIHGGVKTGGDNTAPPAN